MPEPQILALRMMAREYFALSDMLTEMKNRLCTDLYLLFPGYLDVFGNPFGKASLALLRDFPSPQHVLSAERETLTQMISKLSRKTFEWAGKKVDKLFEIATLSKSMPEPAPAEVIVGMSPPLFAISDDQTINQLVPSGYHPHPEDPESVC